MSRYRLSSWASSRRLNCYTLKPFVSDVVCRCRYLPPTQQLQWLTRSFTISPSLAKKGGKAEREEARAQGNASSTEDPYDFSILNKGVDESMSRLTADLDKLRPGGRFNPEVLEAIIVPLGKGSSGQKQKLGSLAQIVPKGRTLTVFVEDKDVCTRGPGYRIRRKGLMCITTACQVYHICYPLFKSQSHSTGFT